MGHCRALLDSWAGGTVVLSPRDLTDEQLVRLGTTLTKIDGASVCLDPQFYLPHADHERLCSHQYWPENYDTGAFWQGPALTKLLSGLNKLNQQIGASAFIVPGVLASKIDSDWLEIQQVVLEEARASIQLPLVLTIAISDTVGQDENQIAAIVEAVERWKPEAVYLVCEHPRGEYLVTDPNWVANILDLCAGIRLNGAEVILGYCNHQMLIAAIAKADAIASGTWMNVRSFPPEKFKSPYDEEMKQRSTWYYCPQALSEYKIPFLDIAARQKQLQLLKTEPELDGGYATILFSGPQPSTVGFNEQMAFRHYLHALRGQVLQCPKTSFDATVTAQRELLEKAASVTSSLSNFGIRGQMRDFGEIIDVNRAALELFINLRGAMLRRRWQEL